MAKDADKTRRKTWAPTIHNRKARHDYFVVEAFEAGIELRGNEVKSVRLGEATLDGSFARVRDGELFLFGCHIKPYEFGDPRLAPDPNRPRKLLVHRRQINALAGSLTQQGHTVVPLQIYFKNGRVKVEVALVRGKGVHDKRQTLRKKEHQREIDQAMRRRR